VTVRSGGLRVLNEFCIPCYTAAVAAICLVPRPSCPFGMVLKLLTRLNDSFSNGLTRFDCCYYYFLPLGLKNKDPRARNKVG